MAQIPSDHIIPTRQVKPAKSGTPYSGYEGYLEPFNVIMTEQDKEALKK